MLLTITQDHIDRAISIRQNAWLGWDICANCPTALALKDMFHMQEHVSVNNTDAVVGKVVFKHASALRQNVISPFNAREDKLIVPGTYTLTPIGIDSSIELSNTYVPDSKMSNA